MKYYVFWQGLSKCIQSIPLTHAGNINKSFQIKEFKEDDSRTFLSNTFWCLPVYFIVINNFLLMNYLNHS